MDAGGLLTSPPNSQGQFIGHGSGGGRLSDPEFSDLDDHGLPINHRRYESMPALPFNPDLWRSSRLDVSQSLLHLDSSQQILRPPFGGGKRRAVSQGTTPQQEFASSRGGGHFFSSSYDGGDR
jgi:hypothetical protein